MVGRGVRWCGVLRILRIECLRINHGRGYQFRRLQGTLDCVQHCAWLQGWRLRVWLRKMHSYMQLLMHVDAPPISSKVEVWVGGAPATVTCATFVCFRKPTCNVADGFGRSILNY